MGDFENHNQNDYVNSINTKVLILYSYFRPIDYLNRFCYNPAIKHKTCQTAGRQGGIMNIETAWMNLDKEHKLYILKDCGTPTQLALNAAKLQWNELSPAMRNVLTRKAIAGQIFI